MEIKKLEQMLIDYYGKHQSDYVQDVTIKYVVRTYAPEMYHMLLQSIMKSHPFKFGFPDIAAIEEAADMYYKKEGSTLRKPKPKKYWHMEGNEEIVDETTDPEAREKFLALVADAAKNNKVKQDDKCQDCTHVTETGENYYCRGCFDYNKYEKKGEDK